MHRCLRWLLPISLGLLACAPASEAEVDTHSAALRNGGREDRDPGRHDRDDREHDRDDREHDRDARDDRDHDRDDRDHDEHHGCRADAGSPPASSCPAAGSGHSGVTAYAVATCPPAEPGPDTALTCNGEFTVALLGLDPTPTVLTATLRICKNGTSPAIKDLSHADLDLTPLLACQAPGTTLGDLLLGCRVLIGGGTCGLAAPDPTTGITGLKVEGVSAGNGCLEVTDGQGGVAHATATVTVANAPPVAVADFATVLEDEIATLELLANDHDPSPFDTLTVLAITQPEGGLAILGPGGQVEVRLEPNASGLAVFAYTLTDGTDVVTGEVTVTFLPTADPVTALNDTNSSAPRRPRCRKFSSLAALDSKNSSTRTLRSSSRRPRASEPTSSTSTATR